MRVLVITNLFPNAQNPIAASFNRQQFSALSKLCDVEVMATIPWFPGIERIRRFSPHGANLSKVPKREVIAGLDVSHPRTFYIPKIGGAVAGPLYAASLLPYVARYRGRVDVVVGSWAYPDGWAAIAIGKLLGAPAVVQTLGSDINVIAEAPGPRAMMKQMLPRAACITAVSRALGRKLEALGVPSHKIELVYNGVDPTLFHVRDRAAARAELGRDPDEKLVVYVGNLLRSKGAVDLLEAFERIVDTHPKARLVLVGRGAEQEACEQVVARLGGRAELAGPRPHTEIPTWIAASDIVSLPSHNEGQPNIVLEALASGRRVVASSVGGIPDLITSDVLGEMVEAKDVPALADALGRALHTDYDPQVVFDTGPSISWAQSAANLLDVLERARA